MLRHDGTSISISGDDEESSSVFVDNREMESLTEEKLKIEIMS